MNSQQHGIDWAKAGPATGSRRRGAGTRHEATLQAQLHYAETSLGQLGTEEGDTFWSAARTILQQTYALLAPSAHAIFVCKRYVRGGQIVEFSQQWVQCCEAVGFRLVHWHKAMLVEEHGTQGLLFATTEEITESLHAEAYVSNREGISFLGKAIRTKRASFFRRLAERKGSPAVDWEDVLCFVRD